MSSVQANVRAAGLNSVAALLDEMKLLGEVPSKPSAREVLNSELWHAYAGPRVSLPQPGSLIYYFPQGHSEQGQVTSSTKKIANSQIPANTDLPSQLMCQVDNVTLHADKEMDEIYAQMTLQPVTCIHGHNCRWNGMNMVMENNLIGQCLPGYIGPAISNHFVNLKPFPKPTEDGNVDTQHFFAGLGSENLLRLLNKPCNPNRDGLLGHHQSIYASLLQNREVVTTAAMQQKQQFSPQQGTHVKSKVSDSEEARPAEHEQNFQDHNAREGQLDDPRGSEWKLVYVDHENDVLLVGDDPWDR
ncbi:hypothetical protein OPV22_009254 [Ensete ventricosum]|uniref:Auxin-responsive protein n=1 Tax=Ensete ventricosum TaxID=4639 RepID=A0AAV8RE18_ENSVE|nr:hypothetical protein OPV22_009254 [Ensete ventricosum]